MIDEFLSFYSGLRNLFRDIVIIVGIEVSQTQIFQFAFYAGNTEARSDRCVNIQSFLSNTLPPLFILVRKSTHIVKTVGKLDDYDAYVIAHSHKHTSQVFRLLFQSRFKIELAQFSYALNEGYYNAAESLTNLFRRNFSIFDYVVQKRGYDGIAVKSQINKNFSYGFRMNKIVFTRLSFLPLMRCLCKIVGFDNFFCVIFAVILLNFIDKSDFLFFHLPPLALRIFYSHLVLF